MTKKTGWVVVPLALLLLIMTKDGALGEPMSDLAQDQFEKGPSAMAPLPRSPFVPAYQTGDDVDLSTLIVQGVIYGKKLKMALLSGRIVKEGEKMGRFEVTTVEPDHVVLTEATVPHTLRVENYVAPVEASKVPGYSVEFRNASLRDALRLLSKCANVNILMPEDLAGRTSFSFHDIDLMEAIRSLLRVNGYEYALEEGVMRVGKPDAFVGGTDLKTQHFRLKYATARDLTERVKPLLSDRGAVVYDQRSNTMTVKDHDSVINSIGSLVNLVDRKDRQVEIEARIVDANKNFSRDLGVRWGVAGETGNAQINGSKDVGTSKDTGNPLNVNLGALNPTSGIAMMFGRLAGALNLEAQLTAAEEKGDVEILAKPSVTTLNNIPAKIRSGTKIYVKSTSNIAVGAPAGNTATANTQGLQEIETGITLTVLPQISNEDFITMKIDAVESEPDFSRLVDGIPSIIDNTASTTVILKDGETTVIGGLSRQRHSKVKRKVPGLGSIPVIGNLFQSNSKESADSELLIFITPKLVGSS